MIYPTLGYPKPLGSGGGVPKDLKLHVGILVLVCQELVLQDFKSRVMTLTFIKQHFCGTVFGPIHFWNWWNKCRRTVTSAEEHPSNKMCATPGRLRGTWVHQSLLGPAALLLQASSSQDSANSTYLQCFNTLWRELLRLTILYSFCFV